MELNRPVDRFTHTHERNVMQFLWESSCGQEELTYPPRSIWIEITTRCTLKCKFCAHSVMKRPGGEMGLDEFKRIIDRIRAALDAYGDPEMTEVSLTRYGEPLVHPRLAEMIAYCKQAGLYTYLPTNGTVMTAGKRSLILDSAIDKMNISVDTIDDDRHRELMGIPIQQRMRNILTLFRDKLAAGRKLPLIEVSMVKYFGWERERDLFERFFRLVGADRINCGDCFNLAGTVDFPFRAEEKTRPCFAPWFTFGVFWNGDVNFCLQDPEGTHTLIGNLLTTPLMELWNSARAREFRRAVWNGDDAGSPTCRVCNVNCYDRYQVKPFAEGFVTYCQRMKTLDPKRLDLEDYKYLSHLQSIASGAMSDRNRDRSRAVLDEALARLDTGIRFIELARALVEKHGD